MKLFRYLWRGLFGPECPNCSVRDFEWTDEDKLKIKRCPGDDTWQLKCNVCGGEYWKFKGSDKRLFTKPKKQVITYKKGDRLSGFELDKMTNTFDGRVICPDCEHYPMCGSSFHHWSCTNCRSEFDYMGVMGVLRISDRMPPIIEEVKQIPPEPDKGFYLEGSL